MRLKRLSMMATGRPYCFGWSGGGGGSGLKSKVFWDVTPCGLSHCYSTREFSSPAVNGVVIYQQTRLNILENANVQQQYCENLNIASRFFFVSFLICVF